MISLQFIRLIISSTHEFFDDCCTVESSQLLYTHVMNPKMVIDPMFLLLYNFLSADQNSAKYFRLILVAIKTFLKV
jgi:hypothetical protein